LTSFVDELLTSFSVESASHFCNSGKIFLGKISPEDQRAASDA
jgi:hypothetical protein